MIDSFRPVLETVVTQAIPVEVEDVALLLSGGVDSLSCGFAAQSVGKRIHAYTFRLDGRENKDSKTAQDAAAAMNWPFTLIEVSSQNIPADFMELATTWKCQKKTQFECTWPFLYVIPAIKESTVLSGIAADGHFGLSKKAMIHCRRPREKFDAFRREYFASKNPAGQVQQKSLCRTYGKLQVAPYLDRRVFDYFICLSWDEINRPHQKMPTLRAYPEWFRRVGRRDHLNLQLAAGIDRAFETLLKTAINTRRRTRVMDLCRDISCQAK